MEELFDKQKKVMLTMLEHMEHEQPENQMKLVNGYVRLYGLLQKDRELDLQEDKQKYDSGRADLEIRVKEETIKSENKKLELEERRLDLDERKADADIALSTQKLKNERANTAILAVARGVGAGFRFWLSSCLMHYDVSGHVIGTALGKKTLDRWATSEEKF